MGAGAGVMVGGAAARMHAGVRGPHGAHRHHAHAGDPPGEPPGHKPAGVKGQNEARSHAAGRRQKSHLAAAASGGTSNTRGHGSPPRHAQPCWAPQGSPRGARRRACSSPNEWRRAPNQGLHAGCWATRSTSQWIGIHDVLLVVVVGQLCHGAGDDSRLAALLVQLSHGVVWVGCGLGPPRRSWPHVLPPARGKGANIHFSGGPWVNRAAS